MACYAFPALAHRPPPAHDQWGGAAQPGTQTTNPGGADLPRTGKLCERLVTALAMEQSEEWVSGRRYLDMEELGEHRCLEEFVEQSEEVMIMEP